MKQRLFVFLMILLVMSSCVTRKRYLKTEKLCQRYETRNTMLQQEVKLLIADKVDLIDKARKLEKDTASLCGQLRQRDSSLFYTRNLLNNNEKELSKKMQELSDREHQIAQLKTLITQQQAVEKNIYDGVTAALSEYDRQDVQIEISNGTISVSVSDNLLFEPGGAVVEEIGYTVIRKLAAVIRQQNDVLVKVIGNTDNRPIRYGKYSDNWELSCMRAIAVVRLFTEEYGIDPSTVEVTGHGEYNPLMPNTTPAGRATNRRTEIVICPDLDLFFEILKH